MHALQRLQGYGVAVVPKAPYRIERVEAGPDTTLRIFHEDGSHQGSSAVVDVRSVARGTDSTDLAEVSEGDPRQRWRLETNEVTCAWPHGFALSSDPDELSPFLLLGPDDAMVWLAGPVDRERATPIEKLVTDDQTVRAVARAGDNERVDLDYVVDGEAWWQRKYVLSWGESKAMVLTGQARRATETVTAAAVDAVEQSISPFYSA